MIIKRRGAVLAVLVCILLADCSVNSKITEEQFVTEVWNTESDNKSETINNIGLPEEQKTEIEKTEIEKTDTEIPVYI